MNGVGCLYFCIVRWMVCNSKGKRKYIVVVVVAIVIVVVVVGTVTVYR